MKSKRFLLTLILLTSLILTACTVAGTQRAVTETAAGLGDPFTEDEAAVQTSPTVHATPQPGRPLPDDKAERLMYVLSLAMEPEFQEAVDSRGNSIGAGGDIQIDGSPVFLLGINT